MDSWATVSSRPASELLTDGVRFTQPTPVSVRALYVRLSLRRATTEKFRDLLLQHLFDEFLGVTLHRTLLSARNPAGNGIVSTLQNLL